MTTEQGLQHWDAQTIALPYLRPIVFEMWKAYDREDWWELAYLTILAIEAKAGSHGRYH